MLTGVSNCRLIDWLGVSSSGSVLAGKDTSLLFRPNSVSCGSSKGPVNENLILEMT